MLVNIDIPKLPVAEIEKLAERIKPLVRHNDVLYHMRDNIDPITVAFTWAEHGRTSKVKDGEFERFAVIPTFHKWGYYGFFKPSIEEVLLCIPSHLIDLTVAFEVEGPEDADDLNAQKDVLDAGYHMAMTTLYRRPS